MYVDAVWRGGTRAKGQCMSRKHTFFVETVPVAFCYQAGLFFVMISSCRDFVLRQACCIATTRLRGGFLERFGLGRLLNVLAVVAYETSRKASDG